MKKIILLLLVIGSVWMTGCSQTVGDGDDSVLTVALSPDYPPYEFIKDANATGLDKYAGADFELAKYIAEELGMTLQIVEAAFDACPTLVSTNKTDISISGFSWTPKRASGYALSNTYFDEGDGKQQILIAASDVDKYKTIEDLNKAEVIVGAQSGSLQDELVDEFLPNCTKQNITELDLGIALLVQGRIHALAISEFSADVRLETVDGIALLPEDFDTPPIGMVVLANKGNTALIDKINGIIATVTSQSLYGTWMEEAAELAKQLGIE